MGHAYKARFWYPFIKEHPIIRNTTLPPPPPPPKKREKNPGLCYWSRLISLPRLETGELISNIL